MVVAAVELRTVAAVGVGTQAVAVGDVAQQTLHTVVAAYTTAGFAPQVGVVPEWKAEVEEREERGVHWA